MQAHSEKITALVRWLVTLSAVLLLGCPPEPPTDPRPELVKRGEALFFNETFGGNGRTCGTCHPAENNFTIDPAFIASLPDDNPLFVAEFNPDLSENFEKPKLMRQFGLILENLDGFGNLENDFVLRGVPHTLGLTHTVESPQGPRTGWSGDGAPGDGTLRDFATGAVTQHFTKTLNRVRDVDFRLPTDDELDALEAFQLTIGRQEELTLPLSFRNEVVQRGQEIFLDPALGKCNICHANAGANAILGGQNLGNANFNTGVEDLPDKPASLGGASIPVDDGFGNPGDGTFNTPSLVEAADTPPFFHNNAVDTIEGAVAFYNGEAFNNSPSGQVLASLDPNGIGIRLDATQVEAVAAFLRVVNALDNVKITTSLLEDSIQARPSDRAVELLEQAVHESEDAARVLSERSPHPDAVTLLQAATRLIESEAAHPSQDAGPTREAIRNLEEAKALLVEE